MAELKSLLAFMDEEDRARALARYDELFRAVGPENEDALSVSFGSAVKQVLALEREQSEARKIGVVPFLQPMSLPAEFLPEKPGGEAAEPGGESSFVRSLADVLEKDAPPADGEPQETIGPMDEEFPLEELLPPGESPLKTWDTVFPEVEIGLPPEPDPIPEEAVIPADEPSSPKESGVLSEGQTDGSSPAEQEEPPEEPERPAEPTEAGETPAEAEEAEPDEDSDSSEPEADSEPFVSEADTEPSEPEAETGLSGPEPAEEPAESEKLPYAVSAGEIAAVFAEEPADLSVPESEPAETAIEAMEEEAPPRSAPKKPAKKVPASGRASSKKNSPPGAGRVFLAVLITFPFIVLWIASFAVFVSLGLAVMALGFACCAGGIYLTTYVTGGKLSFMPDMLLVAGGALCLYGFTLLFLWMGLWIAVGGFASVLRWTGNVYRSILRKKAPRKGGA